jgi:hypothetical protein
MSSLGFRVDARYTSDADCRFEVVQDRVTGVSDLESPRASFTVRVTESTSPVFRWLPSLSHLSYLKPTPFTQSHLRYSATPTTGDTTSMCGDISMHSSARLCIAFIHLSTRSEDHI